VLNHYRQFCFTAFAQAWAHKHRNQWLWTGLAIICGAYFRFRFLKHPGGAELYRHAAQCLWDHQIIQACDRLFTYPPFFALVMLPSMAMPMWLTLVVWFVITVACAIWCCRLVEQIVVISFAGSWSERDRELLRLIAIFVSLKFILAVFENQGFDLLGLTALLLGIRALVQKRDVFAGAALAASAAIKVTPLLFLPYLIFKRRFTAAASFACILALLCFLPDLLFRPVHGEVGYFAAWLRDVAFTGLTENAAAAPHPFWTGANPYNLSIRGALGLMLDGTTYQDHFVLWLRIAQIAFASLIASMLLVSRAKDMIAFDSAILIVAMLMLSPMSSRDHFVQLLLPYYVITAGVMRDRKAPMVGVACLVLSFILTGIPREIVPRAYSEFMGMHSDAVYGTSLLLIYLGAMIRRPERFEIGANKHPSSGDRALVPSDRELTCSPKIELVRRNP
jgi:hypothetical protein